jgi:exoribonuclease R
VTFKIGNGETKSDREWLKKKKDFLEKLWKRSGSTLLRKIEVSCGDSFTNTAKQSGILVVLHKRTSPSNGGNLKEDNPLEINLLLTKNDNIAYMKELLVRLLTHSFIEQMYEFHFRIREQTLFEDILADECLTSIVSLMVSNKKLSRANCVKALDQAIAETVYRLSQKTQREKLVDVVYGFFQEYPDKIKNQKIDILENREEFIAQLLKFLPKNVNID